MVCREYDNKYEKFRVLVYDAKRFDKVLHWKIANYWVSRSHCCSEKRVCGVAKVYVIIFWKHFSQSEAIVEIMISRTMMTTITYDHLPCLKALRRARMWTFLCMNCTIGGYDSDIVMQGRFDIGRC